MCSEHHSALALTDVPPSKVAEYCEGMLSCRGRDLQGEQVQLNYKIFFHKLLVGSSGGGWGGFICGAHLLILVAVDVMQK